MKAFYFLGVLLLSTAAIGQTTRSYDLESYRSLDISGPFYVTLERGSQPYIELSGDKDIIEETTVKIEGRKLVVRYENRWGNWKGNQERVDIRLTFQQLEKLDVSGACKLISRDKISAKYLDLDISGASEIDIEVDVDEIEGDISGASTVNISGNTERQRVDLSGASSYKARDLTSEKSVIDSSGASSATITANREVKAEATGASSIYYYGDPKYVDTNSSGAGSVRKRG